MSTNPLSIGSPHFASGTITSPRGPLPFSNGQAWAKRLLDISILSTLFLAPLVLGGRHPVGELALIVTVLPGCLALVWRTFQGSPLPLTRLHWCLLAIGLLVPLVQMTPLSQELLTTLSPGTTQLVPSDLSVFSGKQMPQTLSLSAWETRQSLPLGIALLATFLCFLARLESREDVDRFVVWIVASGLMLATLAIIQATFDNGKFLWIYDHPSRETGGVPRGPFQNENHLCSLLASLLPCTLYLVFRDLQVNHRFANAKVDFSKSFGSRSEQSSRSRKPSHRRSSPKKRTFSGSHWLAIAACIVIVSTVFATPSRGGIAIIAFAGLTWLSFLGWSWIGNHLISGIDYRKWMYGGLIGGSTLAAAAVTTMFMLVDSLSHWRGVLWTADLKMLMNFPLLGVGLGNHRHAYRAFVGEYNPQTFSTAESSWIQLLTETGSLGFLLALIITAVILLSAVRHAIQSQKGGQLLLAAGVFSGLAASCMHAVGDFPWHIPACLVVVLALAAVALRLQPTSRPENAVAPCRNHSHPLAMMMSTGMCCLLLLGNLWALRAAIPAARASHSWDQFRRIVRDQTGAQTSDSLDQQECQVALSLLRQTLADNPNDLLARTTLNCYLTSRLENQQFEIADPAKLAAYITQQANFIANVCPVEARSYYCAATALAIQGAPLEKQEELLAQAQRLRPIDGRIALKRALNALMTSNEAEAQHQFGIALNNDPTSRAAAVQAVGIIYPLEQIVDIWHPDRHTSALLYALARERGTRDQRDLVGRHYCQALWDEAERLQNASGDLLLEEASKVAGHINDPALGIQIISKRLESNPRNVSLLLARAQLHYAMGNESATVADLAACKNVDPQDERVRRFALRVDREAGLRVH